ncbi:hypothetical protein IAT40_003594 [Kwoniella sp. CBS 6097]
MTSQGEPWAQKVAQIKSELESKFPAKYQASLTSDDQHVNVPEFVQSLLSDRERHITALDVTALAQAIAQREFTSVEVLQAYAHASVIVHQKLNCLLEFFLDEGLERAKELDAYIERTGRTVGPFHGVPISIKDHVALGGHQITAGFLSWWDKHVPANDGALCAILRDAGAVFWVKTVNCQAVMHLECESYMGMTSNPYNQTLTSGGSSGGEGALVGGGGSPLGIGTDIGGSIRCPSAHCGIFGFKPTSGRLPDQGTFGAFAGQESIGNSSGPMGRSARDIEYFVKHVLDAKPWLRDPAVPRMPWRPEEVTYKGGGRLPKVGVLWDDGLVKPLPPMQRALQTGVDKLRAAGFEVVDFKPFKHAEAWRLVSSLYFTDGAQNVVEALKASGEPVKELTTWLLEENSKPRSAHELWDLTIQREAYRAEALAHFLAQDVDVILTPPAPGPANFPGTSKHWHYTATFNLLDYPGAVFPTGLFVNPQMDQKKEERRAWLSPQDEELWNAYSAEKFVGAPLSLQVVGLRWEDEKVLKAYQQISDVVRS